MKAPCFSLTAVLLLAFLPVAGRTMGQGRPPAGQNRTGTFSYTRKQVTFEAVGKKKPIEGMLTLPRSSRPTPAVLFVTGAWTENRDELGGEDVLRSLADYLGEHGIAVLQIKLPIGGRSTANVNSAGSTTFETDIRGGLAYLKQRPEIDPRQTGLFGQNENGAIAAVTATLSDDVSFLIVADTPVVVNAPSSLTPDLVNTYDLRPVLERVGCPVLVLQGDQDKRLPLRENLSAFRGALSASKNRDASFVTLPGLNSALETTTGNGRSESEMAPLAMRTVRQWVERHGAGQGTPENEPASSEEKEEKPRRKQSNPYGDIPGGVIGQFKYRPEVDWYPAIGNQRRPYGYWYW